MSLVSGWWDESCCSNDDFQQWWWCLEIVSSCGDECVRRIPSSLSGSVVENVSLKDIIILLLLYIYCTFLFLLS